MPKCHSIAKQAVTNLKKRRVCFDTCALEEQAGRPRAQAGMHGPDGADFMENLLM